MQSCKLLCGFLLFGIVLMAGCNNRQPLKEAVIAGADTISFALITTQFNKDFSGGNEVNTIPGNFGNYNEQQIRQRKIDSLAFVFLMQDSTKNYFVSEFAYEGTFLHAVVDSYARFTLVCLQENWGDGGDVYTLNTYTKAGVKIANILVAEIPGEESEYSFNMNSVLTNDTLVRYETHCRHIGGQDAICDSFTRYSILKPTGVFVEFKVDSILDNRLDTIRKEIFNY